MNPQAIQEAITLLTSKRHEVSCGSYRVWQILKNAANYLDKELTEYLSAE